MVRKGIKYIKFSICMVLIFSLSMPLYAEGSASDGGAFVTKEEFDRALADFNSRLTAFEAGINSKIDSQVSSYLDRNGIWNGTNQPFYNYALFNDFYSNFSWVVANDENILKAWYIPELVSPSGNPYEEGTDLNVKAVNGPLKVGSSMSTYFAVPEPGSYVVTAKIINSVNKSGLLFLDWIGRDTARMNAPLTANNVNAKQGTWAYNVRYHQGSMTNFTNQSKYNQLRADWQNPLSKVAALGTGTSSLHGWGACVAPTMENAWSSFSLSESVKFHTGYDTDLTGVDAITDLKSEQLLWNYNLQYVNPVLFAYNSYWSYGQYRISLQGDAVQYRNLFFVNKGDPVYASIVFTVSGRTPQNAARFVTASADHHFAGSYFMLDANVY